MQHYKFNTNNMDNQFEVTSRITDTTKASCLSIIPIIPRDSNVIVKAVGNIDVIKFAISLNRNTPDTINFKSYEVVAFGQHVDYLRIGDKVLIPTGISLASRVDVPGNSKSLQVVSAAFEGMKQNEIQSYAAKNPDSKDAEIVEYLGCKAHDIVAILDASYVPYTAPIKSTIIL